MSTTRKLTEQQREQRRQADRDRIEHAARELLCSAGWMRWIRVRATNGLGRYSLRNQWLIAADCAKRGITPTHIAGFRAWLSLERCVCKGQKAIRILAPVAVKERDGGGQETGVKRVFFRSVPVFDVAMTEPLAGREPVPLTPPCEPITGESHVHLLTALADLAAELGYSVRGMALDGELDGWCDSERQEIVVNERLAGNARVRVLVHELAHALGVGYKQYGRRRAEVLVDTVTYIVLGQAGLDVGGESIPYLAGWGEDGALDAIGQYAQRIDEIARRIEDAITPEALTAVDQPLEFGQGA